MGDCNREDHDELEMVVPPHVDLGALMRNAARGLGVLGGHWGDGKPRTGAEATWRSIVGQP